jgi:hypothetical protein
VNEKELTDKLREKYVGEVTGSSKKRTVEEAFQEALDNTTPEHAGAPNKGNYQLVDDEIESEWI